MPKPTKAEVAELVRRLRKMVASPVCNEAADALEALAGEGAEPVAWRLYHGKESGDGGWHYYDSDPGNGESLYAAPPAKPAGELPVHPISGLVPNMRGLGMAAANYIEHHYRDASGPLREILDAASVILPHAADELERAYALRAIQEQQK